MQWTSDDAGDVVAVGLVLFTDNQHRQLLPVMLKLGAKALGVLLVGKVAEILSGQRVCDPLPIDHLALGKRNVDRIWNPVFEVARLEICGGEHGIRY